MSDWWGADPVAGGGAGRAPVQITVRPGGAAPQTQGGGDWWANDPPASSKPNVLMDVAASGASGAMVKGPAGLLGLPETISQLWAKGGDAVLDILEDKLGLPKGWAAETKGMVNLGRKQSFMSGLPRTKDIQGAIETVTGPAYQPQTTAGHFAETAGEMTAGAGRRLVTQALIPGVASEAAGQATAGTKYEPYARGGTAVVTGGLGAIATRPSTAERVIKSKIPGVDEATVARAEGLMRDAQQRGVSLTWAEAIEQVAPGSGLTNTQRVLEGAPGSSRRMTAFMAQRPGQIENAARPEFNAIAPPNAAPSTTGPQAGRAANSELGAVRRRINDTAEPYYDAAKTVRLTKEEMARVRALPGYQEAHDTVRNNTQLNRHVADLPEDSVGFLNAVKKQLDQQNQNAASRFAQNRNQEVAAGHGQDARALRNELTDSYFSQPARNYETALNIESQGRQQFLQPLLDGPLGKLAKRDITTQRAIDALFPNNPVPNSAGEVATAVRAMAARNPTAAADLVRAHVESVFNSTARNLQSGPNKMGGGNFAKELVGNAQQRANLEAAVRALPNGDQTWTGFNRFLEIMQATGKRQDVGSRTAFNVQEMADLSTGGMTANAVKTGAAPARWMTVVADKWSRWQLGNNLDELARIITDPQSGRILRAIANQPAGARQAQILAAQAIRLGDLGATKQSRNDPGNP